MLNFLPKYLFGLIVLAGMCESIRDGLHSTPPMGFSSWNAFFAENDEEKMVGIADAIKRLGLDKFGYVFLTVDDYWNLPERDSDGNMQVNKERFPHGMKFLSDHFHSLGLKFGIYSDAGTYTCAGMAGSLGYEEKDLQLFLEYEIDYLKYDNCYPKGNETNWDSHLMNIPVSLANLPSIFQEPTEQIRFEAMTDLVKQARHLRNITVELCLYGWGRVEEWGPEAGHLWRTGNDARDEWSSILKQLDRNDETRFLSRQGPKFGSWNYPDALFVGKGGMSDAEYRTMFALWCAIKAPLMLGSDLRNMVENDAAFKIITNEELIEINQDKLGIQATCVKDCCARTKLGALFDDVTCPHFQNSWQVWQGPISKNSFVVVIVNRFDKAIEASMDWEKEAQIPPGEYDVHDLWSHLDLGQIKVGFADAKSWEINLAPHANVALKLRPVKELLLDVLM